MIKAVFFDFVGTLLSKESETVTHLKIMEEVVRKANAQVEPKRLLEEYEALTKEKFNQLAGRPYKPVRIIDAEAMNELGRKYGFEVPGDFWEIHLKMHQQYGKLYDEALETLKALRERGLHVGMITDSDNDYLKAHLEALGILKLFNSITTSEEAGFFKPHPKMFEIALKKAGVKGEKAVYVGDNPEKDCAGARQVDIMGILFDRTGEKREQWGECEFIISDLREVLTIVEEL